MKQEARVVCQVCKKSKPARDGRIGELVRPSLTDFIRKRFSQWDLRFHLFR